MRPRAMSCWSAPWWREPACRAARSRPPTRTRAIRSSRSTRPTRRRSRSTRPRRTSPRRWSTTCRRRRPCRRREGARRHRRRAGQAALLARGLRLHADGRESQSAGEGLLDRHDRRRARDDRGRGVVGGATWPGSTTNRARLARLADPRTISLNDAEADKLVDQSVPVYYITGASTRPRPARRPR